MYKFNLLFANPYPTPNLLMTGSSPSLLQVRLNTSLSLDFQYLLRFPLYKVVVEETSHLNYLAFQKSPASYGSVSNSDAEEREPKGKCYQKRTTLNIGSHPIG